MKWGRFTIIIIMLLIMCFLIAASDTSCSSGERMRQASKQISNMQAIDQSQTAETFSILRVATPAPSLKNSQERQNLSKKLIRFNVANKISYIYLVDYGKVMAYYTVRGKVSSVNSMLTCTQQLTRTIGGEYHVVDSPDLDGSYGSNGDAIFFFTTEGVYVEWNGKYMLCDEPLQLSTPPELVRLIEG